MLLEEIRREFQIPPYFEDEGILNYIKEGKHYLSSLVILADFEMDLTAKMLLKNYVFYAYNKKIDEFTLNYKRNILAWQIAEMRKK